MNILKFIVANNILRLRTDAGMSRAELGEKIRYSEDYILGWERAEDMPDESAIAALAEVFGVTSEYLLNSHDEWVSKEEKEYLEKNATLASAVETKNLRAKAEEEPEATVKKKKSPKAAITVAASVAAAVGVLYFALNSGKIGCASELPDNTEPHVHQYGNWQVYAGATEYNEGELRKYCYGCDEYLAHILPQSTQGLFVENLGDGTCAITGVGHGPETPVGEFAKIVIPQYIYEYSEGELVSLRVVAIGNGFLGSLGNELLANVKEIVLPDGIKSIGGYAFYGTGIESIIIPKSVESIGEYAFAHCESLTSAELPEKLASLGEGAFAECTSLENVSVKADMLAEIPPKTFKECTSLKSISLGSVRTIGESAFEGCTGIKNIYFAETAENAKITLGNSAFSGCTSLLGVASEEKIAVIGDFAFADCVSLGKFRVYSEKIGVGAFPGCESLGELELCDGVKTIGDFAFEYCLGLTSVTLPASVETVNDYAFQHCANLEEIKTDGSITKLGTGANVFEGCHSLKKITLYDMGGNFANMFTGNENITDVTVLNGEIPADAFNGCTSLASLSLSEGVTSIGDRAFSGVSTITELAIPSTVTHIGDYAFANTGISELTIGANVEYVGVFAFSESAVQSVTVKSAATEFAGYTFANCDNLKDIILPDGMEKIPEGMFSGCMNYDFTSITLPDSITSIGASAFEKCNWLKTVNIPKGVTEIGEKAFYYCQHMERINFDGTEAEWENVSKGASWKDYIALDLTIACTDINIIYPGTLS